VRRAGVDIEIYHTQLPEAFIDREERQIADVVQLFTNQLGETNIRRNRQACVFTQAQGAGNGRYCPAGDDRDFGRTDHGFSRPEVRSLPADRS